MKSFALISCIDDKKCIGNNKAYEKLKYFKDSILGKYNILNNTIKICPLKGLYIYIITIPYQYEYIKANTSKTARYLAKGCEKIGVDKCYLPFSELLCIPQNDLCVRNRFTGNLIFHAMMTDIIQEISIKTGKNLPLMEIVIMQGNNVEEVKSALRILSSKVKYITVATKNKSGIENVLDEIYNDTGLAIGLTGDYNAAFRNADVIINFDSKLFVNSKIKGYILDYYSSGDVPYDRKKYIATSSLNVGLPRGFPALSNNDIFKFYTFREFAELILMHALDLESLNYDELYSYTNLTHIQELFKNSGYTLSVQGM